MLRSATYVAWSSRTAAFRFHLFKVGPDFQTFGQSHLDGIAAVVVTVTGRPVSRTDLAFRGIVLALDERICRSRWPSVAGSLSQKAVLCDKRNEESALGVVIRTMRALSIMAIVSIIALPIVRAFIGRLVPDWLTGLAHSDPHLGPRAVAIDVVDGARSRHRSAIG
jgi:hypothetical protein